MRSNADKIQKIIQLAAEHSVEIFGQTISSTENAISIQKNQIAITIDFFEGLNEYSISAFELGIKTHDDWFEYYDGETDIEIENDICNLMLRIIKNDIRIMSKSNNNKISKLQYLYKGLWFDIWEYVDE